MTSVLNDQIFPQKFQDIIGKLPHALLTNDSHSSSFKCIQTTTNTYKKDKSYSLYQISCLVRLLGKKLNLFTNDLLKELQEEANELAIIFRWEESFKVIMIIDTAKGNPKELVQWLNEKANKESISEVFTNHQREQERENHRQSKRYKIWPLNALVEFPMGDSKQFRVHDISLSGLKVFSHSQMTLNHYHQVKLIIKGKEPLPLNLKQVWQLPLKDEEQNSPFRYRSGYRIKFFDKKDFKKWLGFLYAFDKINAKNLL